MDQAATLRNAPDGVVPEIEGPATKVIAVSSGKGGVGKTNSVVNLAVAFAEMGKKVLLMDADLGLGNIDVLLGIAPRRNLGDLINGTMGLEEVLVDGPAGVKILPAASGVHELTELTSEQRLALTDHLESMKLDIDIMIIDTGAGISSNVLFFNVAAQEIVVVVSPEPTSLTDAYALMKVLLKKHGEKKFSLIVNTARTKKEGLEVYRKISLAADRFLGISIDYLGCVLKDDQVPKAVVEQRAVMDIFPDSRASECFREIARELSIRPAAKGIKGGLQLFWRKVLEADPAF